MFGLFIKKLSQQSISTYFTTNLLNSQRFLSKLANEPIISSISTDNNNLTIKWNDNIISRFSFIWLRDHRVEDLHKQTLQRDYDTMLIPIDIKPIQPPQIESNGRKLRIEWPQGVISLFDSSFLSRFGRNDISMVYDQINDPHNGHITWDANTGRQFTKAHYFEEIMKNDNALLNWLHSIQRFGFAIVERVPSTVDDTKKLIRRIAFIQQTIFGDFWDLSVDTGKTSLEHNDTSYTSVALPAHTDGCYYEGDQTPGLQFFHVLEHIGKGGMNLLVDGFHIAKQLQQERPDIFEYLSKQSITYRFLEPGVSLRASAPVFRFKDSKLLQFRFNNIDRAPSYIPPDDVLFF